jgi:hypothetical protein
MVTLFTSFLLEFPSLGIPKVAADLCRYIFMLFPNYALSKGFADLGLHSVCPINITCTPPSAFQWDIVGQKLAFMLLSVPVCFAIIMFIEYKVSPVGMKDKYTNVSAAALGGALLSAVCCLLSVVMLSAVCCLLSAVCCLCVCCDVVCCLCVCCDVVCCLLSDVCCLLSVCLLSVVCCVCRGGSWHG